MKAWLYRQKSDGEILVFIAPNGSTAKSVLESQGITEIEFLGSSSKILQGN